jgi:hypothetical protein
LLARNQPLLRGALVEMARTCGKEGCRCQQGHKHVSLYLATRHEGKRSLIYIPKALAPRVREAVQATQQLEAWIDDLAAEELQLLLQDKQQGARGKARDAPPQRATRTPRH